MYNLGMEKRYTLKATTYNKSGQKISTGFNSYTKTHPLQKYFSEKAGDSEYKTCLHAELQALLRARGKHIHGIKVERIEKNGKFGMAKPCASCQEAIKAFGVKQVIFTNQNGDYESYEIL